MPAWACRACACPLALLCWASLAEPARAQTSDLVSANAFRVCADPANLPMSAMDGSGYENRLAELIASKLELPVQYFWFPQTIGFVRNSLRAKRCDVIMGYAQGHELVLNTNHYYTSVYVLIVPEDGDLAGIEALGDPALSGRRIGVIAGTPPADHLARNGLIAQAKSYNLMVDRRHQSPATDMLDDLRAGEIDAAALWGPIGGPLVKSAYPGMKVIPLFGENFPPRLYFRITMGVRQGEKVWQRRLNSLIRRHKDEIDALLIEAGVPLANDFGTGMAEIGK